MPPKKTSSYSPVGERDPLMVALNVALNNTPPLYERGVDTANDDQRGRGLYAAGGTPTRREDITGLVG